MSSDIDIAVRILDSAWRRLWPSAAGRVRRAARVAIACAPDQPPIHIGPATELTIALADDATVRGLNREYRGIDRPTNVLSFDGWDSEWDRSADSPIILGDVVLACETVAAEATAQGKTFPDHAVHLVVHGVLHLLGHDHQTGSEANLMEAVEIRALARLGVANPYAARRPRGGARRRA